VISGLNNSEKQAIFVLGLSDIIAVYGLVQEFLMYVFISFRLHRI